MYDKRAKSFVLNFHGRVTLASVKNFQLVCDEDEVCLSCMRARVCVWVPLVHARVFGDAPRRVLA